MKKSTVVWVLCLTASIALLAGCGKKEEEPEVVEETPVAEVVVQESADATPVYTGPVSYLTGLPIDEKYENYRPVAVMIPNDEKSAMPQLGLSQAGVIYEALVEGYGTRLMAIFDYAELEDLEKVGPVRSTRLYFAYFSTQWDCIICHYGQAIYASQYMNSDAIDNLTGLRYVEENIVYYKDSDRPSANNDFTSGERILDGIEYYEYRTEHFKDFEPSFTFASDEVVLDHASGVVTANVVKPGFAVNKPYFVYNDEDGLYYRYQYGDEHIDGNTGDILTCKNIIIQICRTETLDEKGYLYVETEETGSGYYITNGKAIPIFWENDGQYLPTTYVDENGNEIELNPGTTWICVVDYDYANKIEFLEKEETTSETDD